jgi:hypothetical protein
VGKSEITLICSDNMGLTGNKTFSLIVYQRPKFSSTIPNQIDLIANNLEKFNLPVIEGISYENVSHSSGLPRFVTFNFPLYTFLPDKLTDLGIFTI